MASTPEIPVKDRTLRKVELSGLRVQIEKDNSQTMGFSCGTLSAGADPKADGPLAFVSTAVAIAPTDPIQGIEHAA